MAGLGVHGGPDRAGLSPVSISDRYADYGWAAVFELGHLILSTPYHGYVKNLALLVSARMDAHFTALWEGGHIKVPKFFSLKTVSALPEAASFEDLGVRRVGRICRLRNR